MYHHASMGIRIMQTLIVGAREPVAIVLVARYASYRIQAYAFILRYPIEVLVLGLTARSCAFHLVHFVSLLESSCPQISGDVNAVTITYICSYLLRTPSGRVSYSNQNLGSSH
ncbi:hypothetical protein M404DRAFT_767227 [Pisolithus tinctorius Marx 270]|uniref:Uncharacterized protein n=1 Tax=Pisolithus tinctorius Marx 270 TaxID=870435 RepID=A0A0C3ITP6_PISTI|nr:hypothetical protein M404DRAFT_767227 [Pisolithus tinctorius Marx 270]